MAPAREVGERSNGHGATDRLLGELVAEVRTVKHNQNNASQKMDAVSGKVDALALVVASQGQLSDHVQRLETDSRDQEEKIEILLTDKARREGALGLTNWFFRNWPTLIGMILLAGLVLKANGKI